MAPSEEVSHTAEAIHQEVIFKASPQRVYEALTDAKQFHKVVLLSAAGAEGWKANYWDPLGKYLAWESQEKPKSMCLPASFPANNRRPQVGVAKASYFVTTGKETG